MGIYGYNFQSLLILLHLFSMKPSITDVPCFPVPLKWSGGLHPFCDLILLRQRLHADDSKLQLQQFGSIKQVLPYPACSLAVCVWSFQWTAGMDQMATPTSTTAIHWPPRSSSWMFWRPSRNMPGLPPSEWRCTGLVNSLNMWCLTCGPEEFL